MNAIYLLVHMFGAGMAGYAFCKLCWIVDHFNPSSIQRRKQVSVLLVTVGVVCIVNMFFWVPDYYSKDFGKIVAAVVVFFRLIITLGLSYYILADYIPDLRLKYNLTFIVYKKPDSLMTQVGELVSFAECEAMEERYRQKYPDRKQNFFYSTGFVQQVMSTPDAEFLMLVPGIDEKGEETMMLYPGDASLNKMPIRKAGAARRSADDGEGSDEGDYGGDRAGTTPPGPKG